MVAKITLPQNIKRALNYNEHKVKEREAECIYAHNFLKEADQLHFYEKLTRFEKLISLNKRASTNTVHISLNFAERENLSKETLVEIAGTYMQKIGFESQPYLVYQHHDAAHPHIHIITTNIQKDGKRISLHNLGKNQSSLARKEIEIAFGLVKAEEQNKKQTEKINPVNIQKAVYGKSPTKRAITNILRVVLPNYKYSSLVELNAVLRLYNVVADKGEPGSKIAEHHGLVYRVLDQQGNKIGVPIKSSSILNKPTLNFLERKFVENEILKQTFKKSIKASIDWVLLAQHQSLSAFKKALEKEKITLVIRQNDQEIIYGLTFIDHSTKSVFNGSDIGKEYSAKAILEKCGEPQWIKKQIPIQQGKSNTPDHNLSQDYLQTAKLDPPPTLETLIAPLEQSEQTPYSFKIRKKKKRKLN